jgi:hypothetical protein
VNKEMHIDILPRLRDAVRKKRPKNWKTKLWFLLHDNAPTHRSDLFKDFLAKDNVTTKENLAPTVFYLFPVFQSALNGRSFYDATDIIKNATGELNRLLKTDFQKYLLHLYSSWQNYIVVQGHYFGGNLA